MDDTKPTTLSPSGIRESFSVQIPEDHWEETGPEEDRRLRLLAQCSINGLAFHIEAYRVNDTSEGTEQNIDGDYFEDEWRGLCMLQDYGAYQTTEIGGRYYVIVITPHCD